MKRLLLVSMYVLVGMWLGLAVVSQRWCVHAWCWRGAVATDGDGIVVTWSNAEVYGVEVFRAKGHESRTVVRLLDGVCGGALGGGDTGWGGGCGGVAQGES